LLGEGQVRIGRESANSPGEEGHERHFSHPRESKLIEGRMPIKGKRKESPLESEEGTTPYEKRCSIWAKRRRLCYQKEKMNEEEGNLFSYWKESRSVMILAAD